MSEVNLYQVTYCDWFAYVVAEDADSAIAECYVDIDEEMAAEYSGSPINVEILSDELANKIHIIDWAGVSDLEEERRTPLKQVYLEIVASGDYPWLITHSEI